MKFPAMNSVLLTLMKNVNAQRVVIVLKQYSAVIFVLAFYYIWEFMPSRDGEI